jgi:hypothetical protein
MARRLWAISKIWLASPHSKAFLTLKTDRAKNIAEM